MNEKTVLLVEDDFYIADLYEKAIASKGFRVISARNSKEALKMFEEKKPDLILLDIMLPEMNGFGVLRHVREQAKHNQRIPVVMMTNLNTNDARSEASELKASDYIIKEESSPVEVAKRVEDYLK